MPIQNIETGYKPEFGLGALYSGWNAGTTMRSNEEEILKQLLANKQKAQEMPYELMSKQYQGLLDQARVQDPNFISEALKGYIGQMQSQQAAGTNAMDTLNSKTQATNAENLNNAGVFDLAKKIRDLQLTGAGAKIGFGMGTEAPREGDGNLGLYQDVMNNPNLTPEQKQLVEQDAQKSGMLSNRDALLNKFMRAATNTPEQVNKLALGEQKGLFGLENTRLRSEALLAAARERASQIFPKNMNKQQYYVEQSRIANGLAPGDPEQAMYIIRQMEAEQLRLNAAANKNPIDVKATAETGKVVTQPSTSSQVGSGQYDAPWYPGKTRAEAQQTKKKKIVGTGTGNDPFRYE